MELSPRKRMAAKRKAEKKTVRKKAEAVVVDTEGDDASVKKELDKGK